MASVVPLETYEDDEVDMVSERSRGSWKSTAGVASWVVRWESVRFMLGRIWECDGEASRGCGGAMRRHRPRYEGGSKGAE